jgi:hypothetical protein
MTTQFPRIVAAVSVALFLLGAGCGGAQKIDSKPLPAGINLSGEWWSPQYENMTIVHKGGLVKGTFSYRTGGTFQGELDGDVLKFEWVQPGDFDKARREIRGSGFLRVAQDGRTLEGRWGYDDDRTGGGLWTAEKLVEDEPDYDINEPVFN